MIVVPSKKSVISNQDPGSQGPVQTGTGTSSRAKDNRGIDQEVASEALDRCKWHFRASVHYGSYRSPDV